MENNKQIIIDDCLTDNERYHLLNNIPMDRKKAHDQYYMTKILEQEMKEWLKTNKLYIDSPSPIEITAGRKFKWKLKR